MIHIAYRRDYRTCTACHRTQFGELMRVLQLGNELITLCPPCTELLARELTRPERRIPGVPISAVEEDDDE